MTLNKQPALDAIEKEQNTILHVADEIWDYAELSLQEFRSAKLYCEVLKQEGFRVEEGVCGIATAFAASFGSGRPHIGILAEYDALSGLSQQGGQLVHAERTPGGTGHGCGHNLLGAGALAAAIGVKAWLEQTGCPGTVTLYGCPGEEGGAAKAYMAREGLWYGLDAALTWHPEDCNEVITGGSNACIQVQYTFHGVASHAAGAPELGRSALDAVELMNIGVQFLREHMTDDARIHYAILDAGGRSPNVVQSASTVLYMVRSKHVAEAVKLQARVDKIADGAALMTETSYDRKFIDGLADTVPNIDKTVLLAAVGVGWTAACVAQPELLGTESLLTTRLLIALFGALCFGAVGLADDVVRLRHRSPLGLRRPVRLALEAASGTLVLALLGLNHCLPDGLAVPGVGYCTLGPLAPVVWLVILVALAESARTADGMDGTVCGCAFIAMLGLMTAMTLLGWFPLGVLPAALAGALMAFLLWNFYPAKLRPGAVGCQFLAGALGCVPLSVGWPGLTLPLALPYWLEGGMVALQIIVWKASGGRRQLFGTAPLHRWLEKRGFDPVNIFYIFGVLAMLGLALTLQAARAS